MHSLCFYRNKVDFSECTFRYIFSMYYLESDGVKVFYTVNGTFSIIYVYFADNLTQRLFLGMLVIVLGQIGDYLLFKETQRILINTVKYEMTEEFNKKLAHEKFKFQIRMMGLSVIVFMGILSCFLSE